MGGDFSILVIEVFKHNNLFTFQADSIQGKHHFHTAGCFFRYEGGFASDLLVINQKRLVCGFIHQHAFDRIGLAHGKILIADHINDGSRLQRQDFLISIHAGCRCADLRLLKRHSLSFIFNLRMNSDLAAFVLKRFKYNNSFPLKQDGVHNEFNLYCTGFRLGDKGFFGSELLAVNLQRFACGFINQGSFDGIRLTNDQVFKRNHIDDCRFRIDIQFFFAIGARGGRADLRIPKGYGLPLVLNICMYCNLFAFKL